LKTGALTERALDDEATEFPRINDGIQGLQARYSYNPRLAKRPELMFDALVKYDLSNGGKTRWEAPKGWYVGEASFAPAPNAKSEDHGWLITYGTNQADQTSAAFVLDARDLPAGPVAVVHLPKRIQLGFHSYWCGGAV
jgi:carotenoid cleavage dioxygenase